MPDQFIVKGGEDFGHLARKLKDAGDKLGRQQLTAKVKEFTKPAVEDVRSTIRSMPVRGAKGGGAARRRAYASAGKSLAAQRRIGRRSHSLRATISKAVTVKQTTSVRAAGVRVRVNSSALPPDQKKLPKLLARPNGWRHPVMGNRHAWVSQFGLPDYFNKTLNKHAPEIRQRLVSYVQTVLRRVQQ